MEDSDRMDSAAFIEAIRPFLTFYRRLNKYSCTTKRISKKAQKLREAIAKSTEPEKTFFDDIPEALGYDSVQLCSCSERIDTYLEDLEKSIAEIRLGYDSLIDRIENFMLGEVLGETLKFPVYKIKFQERYKHLKVHMLQPRQKTFYMRLMLDLNERNAWVNGFCQPLLGVSLEELHDEDEVKLYTVLKEAFHELDELNVLSLEDVDATKEDVLNIEISTFAEGTQKKTLRLRNNAVNLNIEQEIKSKLPAEDRNLRIALLVKLLQEELKKG